MALPTHTPLNYRIWHYTYLFFCGLVFFFLIAPLFVILPLSFNAEQYIHFSAKMLALDPEGFSLRWYEDMIYGTKNPWGLATKNSLFSMSVTLSIFNFFALPQGSRFPLYLFSCFKKG